jgi:hypothetical protein
MKILKKFGLVGFVIIFAACSKQSQTNSKEDQASSVTSSGIKPVVINLVDPDEAKKYTEFACVTGNCAGTACEGSKGSCRKKACTALPDACTRQSYSQGEIEALAARHANDMVAQGFIDQSDFEKSKKLAIEILRSNGGK